MVLFLLSIKADLEGVDTLALIRKDTNICFSLRNPLSDFETREKVVFDPSEELEQEEGSREPPHHFKVRWEGSKKFSTIIVLDDAATKAAFKKSKKKKGIKGDETVVREMKADDNGEYVTVLAMECRGVEPYAFHPLGNEFRVTSEGGAVFEDDVDLSEGDWADYDVENDASVSITDFESRIVAA